LTAASTSGTGRCSSAPAWKHRARSAPARSLQCEDSPRSVPGAAARTMGLGYENGTVPGAARPRGDHPTFSMPLGQGTEPLGSKSRAGPTRDLAAQVTASTSAFVEACDHRPACRENVGNHDTCRLSRAWWAQQQHAVLRSGERRERSGPRGRTQDRCRVRTAQKSQAPEHGDQREFGSPLSGSRGVYQPTSWSSSASLAAADGDSRSAFLLAATRHNTAAAVRVSRERRGHALGRESGCARAWRERCGADSRNSPVARAFGLPRAVTALADLEEPLERSVAQKPLYVQVLVAPFNIGAHACLYGTAVE